jgi:hypothetical protein
MTPWKGSSIGTLDTPRSVRLMHYWSRERETPTDTRPRCAGSECVDHNGIGITARNWQGESTDARSCVGRGEAVGLSQTRGCFITA